MNTENQNQDQGKEAKKVLAGFEQTVKKLTAIVKGPENLKLTGKVKKDAMQELVEELKILMRLIIVIRKKIFILTYE